MKKKNSFLPIKSDNQRYHDLYAATEELGREIGFVLAKMTWVCNDLGDMAKESNKTMSLALLKLKGDIEKLQQDAKDKGLT